MQRLFFCVREVELYNFGSLGCFALHLLCPVEAVMFKTETWQDSSDFCGIENTFRSLAKFGVNIQAFGQGGSNR